jgi:hypothetical protein
MFWGWLSAHWISILETLSVVFAAVEIRASTKSRRLSNLFILTESHREIWSLPLQIPSLGRVLMKTRNMSSEPLTFEQEEFLNLVFLHLKASYEALNEGLPLDETALVRDVRDFFKLPSTIEMWRRAESFFEPGFRDFIKQSVSNDGSACTQRESEF